MTAKPRTLRTLDDLMTAGLVDPSARGATAPVLARYAVAITPEVGRLIDPSNPHDPIARQFVPTPAELSSTAGELADPIGDHGKSPVAGLVHRYPDRVLLKVSGICPVYCRFCFRREMVGPGKGTTLSEADLARAFAYINDHPGIWEVILTGGDPLALAPRRIRHLVQALGAIDHVKILRWHTRVPVVAPDLVTADLLEAITSSPKTTYLAVHANHPRELTETVRATCRRLTEAGVILISQTVLLRGVNDCVDTLEALMRRFTEFRIKPYYLHHGDLAPGTSHFRVPIDEGRALCRSLRSRLSGLAMPTYMLDIPGGHGKVPIGPVYLEGEGGQFTVRDPRGERHAYRDETAAPAEITGRDRSSAPSD